MPSATTLKIDDSEVVEAFLRVSHAFEGGREYRAQLYTDYAPFFAAHDLVLDIGCGDGTWLQVLRDHGVTGIGIDRDPEKAEECRREDIEVICSDDLSDAAGHTPTALTALHIVEHLEPLDVMRLLMTLDVDKVLIVTPNIDHPPVLANFWKDITHTRPYPRVVVEEMCRQAGFTGGLVSGTHNFDMDTFVFAYKPGTPGWPAEAEQG